MKNLVLVLCLGVVASLSGPQAVATQVTIDFNGQPSLPIFSSPGDSFIEDGFTITVLGARVVFDEFFSPGGVGSGDKGVAQFGGDSSPFLRFVNGGLFSFVSFDLRNQVTGDQALDVTITGYLGAAVVASDTFTPGNSYATASASNLSGKTLDRLEILFPVGSLGYWTNFDNVVLETEIPEPTTMALLGVGAAGLIARRRRVV